MRPGRRKVAVVLSLLFLCFCTPGTAVPSAQMQHSLAQSAAESHLPVVACAVVSGQEVLYEEIIGPGADPDTPFLLGSLSKSFTALGILMLAEQGCISLDAPLSVYLPDAQAEITIRQLLNQTGGIGTYQTLADYAPDYPPGEHIYANTNYALLGRVIEAVTGISYAQYLREQILLPLQMNRTSADPSDALAAELVQGHINLFGFPVPVQPQFPDGEDWIQPAAGYIYSSLRDMERYLQMYLREGENLVSPETLRLMLNDGILVNDEIPYTYAMGWTRIDTPFSYPVYRHAGLVETGMTCMYLLPDQNLGVIFLASGNDYLVGTDLMDRLGWNFILDLIGEPSGTISPGEYTQSHLWWNTLYAAVLVAAAIPLLQVRRNTAKRSWIILVLAFALPVLLLLIPGLFLQTPLWVVRAFVPDLYAVLLLAGALLLGAGIWQLVKMRQAKKEQ